MEDPLFPVTITVGGTGLSYKFAAFPKQMHANQSFVLEATIVKAGAVAYDLTSATATLYVSGWKNEIAETTLVTGVIVSNVITFTVPKDLIPESLGGLPLRPSGNSVFYFIVEDTDSTLQFFQQVNVLDTDYTLGGEVVSSPNVIVPDKNDLGTVLEVNLNTPPGSPAFQDAYIIGTSPTGDWAGQNNDLAVFNGSSWVFYDTVEGNFVFDSDTSQQQIFNGTTWGATASVTYSDGESIDDNNGNELITFGVVGSAVNDIKLTNAITTAGPTLAANGDDANIDLNINAKGSGVVKLGSDLDLNGNSVIGLPDATDWQLIASSKYTATPASTSSITMSDTSDLKVGMALRYSDSGGPFYAIVDSIVTNTSIAVKGAPLDTGDDLTLLYFSFENVIQFNATIAGLYGASADANLLATIAKFPFQWQGRKSYCVAFKASQETVDATAQPKININCNNLKVSTNDTNNGIQLSTSNAFVENSAIAISTTNYEIEDGEELEIECTVAGTAGDAENLNVEIIFVTE